ncbi:MAG: cupin domain-containing protein [Ignavibacteriae bacterium]|nr:cupin domain-containing protein [Ignavibacteriota bacterium]
MNNIFSINKDLNYTSELFFELFKNGNCLIEKIISTGQTTKDGEWLEEDRDEWVILLQGFSEIKFFDGNIFELRSGDYLLIPSNTKHRVESTSANPPCIWLAIHIK